VAGSGQEAARGTTAGTGDSASIVVALGLGLAKSHQSAKGLKKNTNTKKNCIILWLIQLLILLLTYHK